MPFFGPLSLSIPFSGSCVLFVLHSHLMPYLEHFCFFITQLTSVQNFSIVSSFEPLKVDIGTGLSFILHCFFSCSSWYFLNVFWSLLLSWNESFAKIVFYVLLNFPGMHISWDMDVFAAVQVTIKLSVGSYRKLHPYNVWTVVLQFIGLPLSLVIVFIPV